MTMYTLDDIFNVLSRGSSTISECSWSTSTYSASNSVSVLGIKPIIVRVCNCFTCSRCVRVRVIYTYVTVI